jgi:hypothetical protein
MEQGSDSTAASDSADPQRAAWLALPKRLFLVLGAIDTFFILFYFAGIAMGWNSSKLFELFNVDIEANLPSWYAGTQLFIVAIGYLVLGSRLVPDRRKTAVLRPLWLVLGIGFTVLSADEVGMLHERVGNWMLRHKVFSFHYLDQWMVLYLIIAGLLLLIFGKQLIRACREWPLEALLFLLGFMVLASGGFAAEMMQILRRYQGWRHLFLLGMEEWTEMLGVTILILPAYRILSYAMTAAPESGDEGPQAV